MKGQRVGYLQLQTTAARKFFFDQLQAIGICPFHFTDVYMVGELINQPLHALLNAHIFIYLIYIQPTTLNAI